MPKPLDKDAAQLKPADKPSVLYTADVLELALRLADFPLADDLRLRGNATSRICGSKVVLGLALNDRRQITKAGAMVSACAMGQAAAAIFLQHSTDHSLQQITDTPIALANWLKGDGTQPPWPELDKLAAARDFPARHNAILLPWEAAKQALSL